MPMVTICVRLVSFPVTGRCTSPLCLPPSSAFFLSSSGSLVFVFEKCPSHRQLASSACPATKLRSRTRYATTERLCTHTPSYPAQLKRKHSVEELAPVKAPKLEDYYSVKDVSGFAPTHGQ